MQALVVEQLSKTYPNGTRALIDVNFEVNAGERVILLGPNGSGKSTLFRCLVGLEKPSGGVIRMLGQELNSATSRQLRLVRSQVGLVFQQFHLIQRLSVFHNVLLGAMGHHTNPLNWWPATARQAERERVMHCLERVNLAHLAERRADALSGGQQQRVAIARMLMQNPKIILADEPVASLDPKAAIEVMELLCAVAEEEQIALICTLHQLDYAYAYGHRFIGLQHGRHVIDRTVSETKRETLELLYHHSVSAEAVIAETKVAVLAGGMS
jgi:phosphonate transport system ATP-binding protein